MCSPREESKKEEKPSIIIVFTLGKIEEDESLPESGHCCDKISAYRRSTYIGSGPSKLDSEKAVSCLFTYTNSGLGKLNKGADTSGRRLATV